MAGVRDRATYKELLEKCEPEVRDKIMVELDSPEFERDSRAAFVRLDTDGSNCLERAEISKVVELIQVAAGKGIPKFTQKEVNKLMDEFDDDKSGQIEFPEYLAMTKYIYAAMASNNRDKVLSLLSTRRRAQRLANLWKRLLDASELPRDKKASIRKRVFKTVWVKEQEDAFDRLDTDGSGTMDTTELRGALSIIGRKAGFEPSPESVELALREFDTDGHGELSKREFIEMARFIQIAKDIGRKDLIIQAFTRAKPVTVADLAEPPADAEELGAAGGGGGAAAAPEAPAAGGSLRERILALIERVDRAEETVVQQQGRLKTVEDKLKELSEGAGAGAAGGDAAESKAEDTAAVPAPVEAAPPAAAAPAPAAAAPAPAPKKKGGKGRRRKH